MVDTKVLGAHQVGTDGCFLVSEPFSPPCRSEIYFFMSYINSILGFPILLCLSVFATRRKIMPGFLQMAFQLAHHRLTGHNGSLPCMHFLPFPKLPSPTTALTHLFRFLLYISLSLSLSLTYTHTLPLPMCLSA